VKSGSRTGRSRAIAAVAATFVLAACAADDRPNDGSGSTASAPPATAARPSVQELAPEEDFYAIPGDLPPAEPGRLVRKQSLQAPPGMRAWRVLYHSKALDGRDIVVSGLVFAPAEPVESGSRTVVAWGHGSVGLGDKCAPSRFPWALGRLAILARLIEEGFVVTATDYEGLGTPGPHPWLVGVSEGRGVLDSVRAARQIPESGAGERFVGFGGSQGGGAVLFAGELVSTYAGELQLLGVVAAAPAAELDLLALVPRRSITGINGFLVMGALGFAAAYPGLPLEAILSPEVVAQRPEIETLCQEEIDRRFRSVPLDDLLQASPGEVRPWADAITANTPGQQTTPAPVLLIHGTADRVVPPEVSQLLLQRLCGLGVKAERRLYEGIGHVDVFGPSSADVLEWIRDRAAGRELSPDPGGQSC
jgi:fermentation-respiration switch protein FrsA (DUF1100 family)